MKKILLLLLFLFIPKVDALTYSDYSDFSEFTEEPVTATPLIDVITEKRYNYYKLNKILGPYLLAGEESDYEYLDYDDYILSSPSEFSTEKPDDTDRIITTKTQYKYQSVSPVNYVQVFLSQNTSAQINIKSLRIYYNDEEIKDYNTVGYRSNYNVATSSGTLKPGGDLKINFHETYNLNELKIVLELDGNYTNIEYTYTSGVNNTVYTSNDFKYQNIINLNEEFLFKNAKLENPEFVYFYDDEREESNVLQNTNEIRYLYSYQDKLYRYYNLEKVYNNKYTKQADGEFIYKDENDYKVYYAYRTRSIISDLVSTSVLKETDGNLVNTAFLDNRKQSNNIDNINSSDINNKEAIATNDYQKPLETIDYQKANIIDDSTQPSSNISYLIYFFLFLILSIIILLLSKCYKSKLKCAKV